MTNRLRTLLLPFLENVGDKGALQSAGDQTLAQHSLCAPTSVPGANSHANECRRPPSDATLPATPGEAFCEAMTPEFTRFAFTCCELILHSVQAKATNFTQHKFATEPLISFSRTKLKLFRVDALEPGLDECELGGKDTQPHR